jgi:hypothetical protein
MEAVCNDACLRKVLFNQRSVAGAHIHAHDPDFVAAWQGFVFEMSEILRSAGFFWG